MHIHSHLLSGWCVANLFPGTPRDRMLAMIAATAPDLDGAGLVFGVEPYLRFHHVAGHNLFFLGIIPALLAGFASRWVTGYGLGAGLILLHLILDLFGSGQDWGIAWLWPLREEMFACPYAWPLASWQNFLVTLLLLAWTGRIGARLGRTPLEIILPRWDALIVDRLRSRFAGTRRVEP